MRDPKRIPEILAFIRKIWEGNPDLRLTQLIANLFSEFAVMYYTEDDKLRQKLQELYKTNNSEEWLTRIKTPYVGAVGIVECPERKRVLLIRRVYPPHGIAFPGGFMDVGETLHETVEREVEEETGIKAQTYGIFRLNSQPKSDPRAHVLSVFMILSCIGEMDTVRAGDDASDAFWIDYLDTSCDKEFAAYYRHMMDAYREWRKNEYPLVPPG